MSWGLKPDLGPTSELGEGPGVAKEKEEEEEAVGRGHPTQEMPRR